MLGAGEWAQDLQEGLGTCQHMDGTEYKGRWKGGLRHGRGAFTRPGGYAYDGDWAEDCPHGTGTCHFEDGARHSPPPSPLNHLSLAKICSFIAGVSSGARAAALQIKSLCTPLVFAC